MLAGKARVRPGDTVWLRGGRYLVRTKEKPGYVLTCRLAGAPDAPIHVRQVPGERAILDGALEVEGPYVWYWGFEVTDSRHTDKTKPRRASINVRGAGTRFINLIVHGGGMGFGFWSPAVDAEIYGCIIYGFGHQGADRGHGHAVYTQNETGTKRIIDNIMFGGYGWNIHLYGEQGKIIGYRIEGNILFGAGVAARPDEAPKDNALICARTPADRIAFVDNIAYSARTGGWRPNVRLGTYGKALNGTALVEGNTIMGLRGLELRRWRRATARRNTIWAPSVILAADPGEGVDPAAWTIDENTYIGAPSARAFNGLPFEAYRKKTGFDAHSRFIAAPAGRPAGTRIFVRTNRYEPGRAHIAVLDWDGREAVDVDLGRVLRVGDPFEVRNVQDLFGAPVAEGTYGGRPIRLPLARTSMAPDFDAFLVRSRGAGGGHAP